MKKWPLIILIWFALFVNAIALADSSSRIHIAFTNDMKGEILPRMVCGGANSGGLSRRSTVINAFRSEKPPLLVFDLGNALPRVEEDIERKSDVILKVMDLIKYDALNLGTRELHMGIRYLERISHEISIPLLSSNAESKEAKAGVIHPYLIKQVYRYNIAILGILPEMVFTARALSSGKPDFIIRDPKSALTRILPDIVPKADFIILLSNCPADETMMLLEHFPEINLAISSGDETDEEDIGDTWAAPLIKSGRLISISGAQRIKYVSLLKAELGDEKTITIAETMRFDLNNDIPSNAKLDRFIQDSYFTVLRKENNPRTKLARDLHETLKQGLNKTPEAFLQEQQKQ